MAYQSWWSQQIFAQLQKQLNWTPPPTPSREFREAVVTDSLVNAQFSLLFERI